jgi:hypothetical protein
VAGYARQGFKILRILQHQPGVRIFPLDTSIQDGSRHSLMGSILVCSCGYKPRYGIPCRHLFSLEPKYDFNDIYCRWQGSYTLFAFHPSCQSTTKDFLRKSKIEHIGLSLKTMKQNQQEHILATLSSSWFKEDY